MSASKLNDKTSIKKKNKKKRLCVVCKCTQCIIIEDNHQFPIWFLIYDCVAGVQVAGRGGGTIATYVIIITSTYKCKSTNRGGIRIRIAAVKISSLSLGRPLNAVQLSRVIKQMALRGFLHEHSCSMRMRIMSARLDRSRSRIVKREY